MQPRLFVYGTLRKQLNHPLHQLLARHGTYAGMGAFQGRLYDLGRYPGAVSSPRRGDRILGEIYRLRRHAEVFKSLDDYEGRSFSREQVDIFLAAGKTIRAWIYLYRGGVEERRRIRSGDYLEYLNRLS